MFAPSQFGLLGYGSLLAAVGLVSLWRRRTFRFLVIAYPVACAATLYAGGRPDHGMVLGFIVTAVVSVPPGLPVLTVSALDDLPIGELNETAPESIGWERFAAQIGEVSSTISTPDRLHTIVFAENYGQAGAVDRWSDQC